MLSQTRCAIFWRKSTWKTWWKTTSLASRRATHGATLAGKTKAGIATRGGIRCSVFRKTTTCPVCMGHSGPDTVLQRDAMGASMNEDAAAEFQEDVGDTRVTPGRYLGDTRGIRG